VSSYSIKSSLPFFLSKKRVVWAKPKIFVVEVCLVFFEKLKQVFKGKNDEKSENVAENIIEDNKDALNENMVYPENVQESGEEKADTPKANDDGIEHDASYVPKQDNENNEELDSSNSSVSDNNSLSNQESEKNNQNPKEKGIDYDKEIEKLLKQDENIQVNDAAYDYINDISVYDTLRNEKDEVLEEIDNELKGPGEGLSSGEENAVESNVGINKLYILLIGVISILIISFLIVIIFVSSVVAGKKAANTSGKNVLSPAAYKTNKANYIYVSQTKSFDEQNFELSKILVDSQATLFYFSNRFNIQKYNIMLTDNQNNSYGMDLSFIQNMSPITEEEDDENGTVLRFEPLNLNAKSIKLSIYNVEKGEKIDFDFDFDAPLEKTPVKYIFDQKTQSNSSDVNITIDNAVFSSAGSTINYTIKSSGKGFSIVQEKGGDKSTIVLEENAETIRKNKKYPSMYTFNNGNMIVGRMDFESIKNLNSKIYISFNNLYKSYTVNRDITAGALNSSNEKKPISFDVGNYKVVLEGIGNFNDRIVLVFHGEDKNIKYDANNPNANRVEVRLNAQLISSTASGMEVILDGTSKSAEYGTDMSFPINDSNRNLIYNLGAGNLTVRVNSVLVKTDDAKFEFDLRKAATENNKEREKAHNDVIDIFKGRLAYKSGEKIKESVDGFSEQLMKDGSALANYAPQQITERAEYSSQIVSSALEGDKFYAVVQDAWKGINGIKENHSYDTHKIVAQKGDYFWTVIEDNIIK